MWPLPRLPSRKLLRGQRVIVSGVDGPLADVVNGVRGTVIDLVLGARAGNQWLCKVELDTGRPIKQPLNRLYPLPQPSSTCLSSVRSLSRARCLGFGRRIGSGTQPTKRPHSYCESALPGR